MNDDDKIYNNRIYNNRIYNNRIYNNRIYKSYDYISYDYIKQDNKIIKEDLILKFDKYSKTQNFNDLFRSSRALTPSPTQTTWRWSPRDSRGRVYEWDRGVIGISETGEVIKINLDNTNLHHADATYTIANRLGFPISNSGLPFQLGEQTAKYGAVIIQLEGMNCFVYLPTNISKEQQDQIELQITPREGFDFSYIRDSLIQEEQTANSILDYVKQVRAEAQAR